MTKNDNKKDITRKNLQEHGISYDERVYHCQDEATHSNESYSLPDHVDAVREALLTFEGIVPEKGWEEYLDIEFKEYGSEDIGPAWNLQPPASAIIRQKSYERDLRNRSAKSDAAHNRLVDCERVAELARESLKKPESGWKSLWISEVFRPSSKKARSHPGYSNVLDEWSLEQDVTWTEFPNFESQKMRLKDRTQPKPDLTYAFPILNPDSSSVKGFERDEFRQCFSLRVLGELKRNEVFSAPTTGLRRWMESPEKTSLHTSDLSCFPWAVVEMKRHTEQPENPEISTERCYCQAANAAAAALTLQAQLLERNFGHSFSNLPPVIAFTCIGPIVKVWLAYRTTPSNFLFSQQRMVCIWSTSALLTWGVAALRAIIANMHIWASRLLKPKIQAWIFQAFRQLSPRTSRKIKTPKTRRSGNPLASSPQINTPSSSNFNFPDTNWKAFLTPTSSSLGHALRSSPVVQQPPPVFAIPTLISTKPIASQNAEHVASTSPAPRIFTPEPQENSAFMSDSEARTNLPTAKDTNGHSKDKMAALDNEPAKTIDSNDQEVIDDITRALKSSKLEDSISNYSERSDLREKDEQSSRNGQDSEKDSEYLHNSSLSLPSTVFSEYSVALTQYSNNEAEYDSEKELDDSEEDLDDSEEDLDDSEEDLDDSEEDLDDSEEDLDDSEEELDDSEEDLDGDEEELDDDEEDLDDSDFEPGDESKDESDYDSESGEDTNALRRIIHVSDEDIDAWKAASLGALSGKQIAEMPILEKLFRRLHRRERRKMTLRALGTGKMKGDFDDEKDEDVLGYLLDHLNLFLEPEKCIEPGLFLHRRARGRIRAAVASIDGGKNYRKNMWLCLQKTLCYRSGYVCVEILSPDLLKLSSREKEEMNDHAFRTLNKADQKSGLLR